MICPDCKRSMGFIMDFEGILDGHCVCGYPIKICITHSLVDLEYKSNMDCQIIYEKKLDK